MSVAELRTQIQGVIAQLASTRGAINTAAVLVDEARSTGRIAFQGSVQPEAAEHASTHAEALGSLAAAVELLGQAIQRLESYLDKLGPGKTAGAPRTASAQSQTVASAPEAVPWAKVEEIRAGLPPPVSPGTGQKTHGVLVANNKEIPITSGRDTMSAGAAKELRSMGIPRVPARTSDVEMKVAYWQKLSGTEHATVVINNVPCKGQYSCDELVPILLPDGSTLTVHGQTTTGVKFQKRYTGGKKPWWN